MEQPDPRRPVIHRSHWLTRAVVPALVAASALVAGCGPVEDTPPRTPPGAGTVAAASAVDAIHQSVVRSTHDVVADYEANGDTLIVREEAGRIEALLHGEMYTLRPIPADAFVLEGSGVRAGGEVRFRDDPDGGVEAAILGDVLYRRIRYGGEAGATFRIEPVRPVETLRAEARAASPPVEEQHLRAPDLVDLKTLDPTIRFDIRYATPNNFMGAAFYEEARAFLQRPAAEALLRAHQRLRSDGLGLLVFDAYRPWSVTWMFFQATPRDQRHFVANPASGSRHNRGAAVDVTLYDLATGEPVPMPSGYDEFSRRAYPDYPGGMSIERRNRDRLRAVMEAEGFRVYHVEWWHFDHEDWRRYPILNLTFDEIEPSAGS